MNRKGMPVGKNQGGLEAGNGFIILSQCHMYTTRRCIT